MTCIAAVVHKGHVSMGGDAAAIAEYDLTVRSDPKVFYIGEYLFGFTWSFRMGQLLRFGFTPPPIRPDTDMFRYMSTRFVDAVRDCLRRGGFARRDQESEVGGQFLVGLRGRLFVVEQDYQVGIPADRYHAIGCGAGYATGVLYATQGIEPKRRLKLALEASERHCAGVRGPFTILGPEHRPKARAT